MSVVASVIVPVHNGAATLRACLDSVLAQDGPPFEVVVADDASTDASTGIVAAMARTDARLRLVRLARNAGPAEARNAAIRAARGAVLVLLDSDCVAEAGWLAGHCRAQRHAPIVGGAVVGIHRTAFGRADTYCSWFASMPTQPAGLRTRDHLPTANLSVARGVFERIGLFREGERLYSEDAELGARARRAGEAVFFDPSIRVRHHDRDDLRAYLAHQWAAGIQMLNYRREPGAAYRWAMPRGPARGALVALPLALAYTALIVRAWIGHDRRVLWSVPLIFAGKLAQASAMAAYSRVPSSIAPDAPLLPARPPAVR